MSYSHINSSQSSFEKRHVDSRPYTRRDKEAILRSPGRDRNNLSSNSQHRKNFDHPPIATSIQTLNPVNRTCLNWGLNTLENCPIGGMTMYPNANTDRQRGQVLRYIHENKYQGRQFMIVNINPEIVFPNSIPDYWNKETLILKRVV